YETPHFLHSLFAGNLALLKELEEACDVSTTTRDAWLRIEGDPSQVDRACGVMDQLEASRREGTEITKHLFNYALQSMKSDLDTSPRDSLQELSATRLQLSSSKPAVTAKTHGQLRYLKALENFDVVFGVGPAGTGKTY